MVTYIKFLHSNPECPIHNYLGTSKHHWGFISAGQGVFVVAQETLFAASKLLSWEQSRALADGITADGSYATV